VKKPKTLVPHVLTAIFIGFIGIMVYVYVEARRLNPVLLDEYGRVRGEKR
jgi:hypothetical protein